MTHPRLAHFERSPILRSIGRSLPCGLLLLSAMAWPVKAQVWEIAPSITLSETFTDNEDLDSKGDEDPALITELIPAISINGETRRVTANVSAAVNLSHQALTDEGVDTSVSLSGFSNVEFVENLFFTDVRASVSQELIDRTESSSAASANDENLDTVQTYEVSPYLLYDFGSFASSELRYQFGYVNSESDDFSKSFDHLASLNMASGRDFTRILWGVGGSARREFRKGDDNIEAYSGELALRLVVDPTFSLLATGGYNAFDDNDGEDFSEPIWQAGFLWTPTRRTELRAQFGRRSGFISPSVFLRYDVGTRTQFTAEYSEGLGTGQSGLIDTLSTIGQDEEGRQVNTRTRRTFQATNGAISLDDDTARTKTGTATLSTAFGRNTATLAATYSERNELDSPEDETTYLASLQLSRSLSRDLIGSITAEYADSRFKDGEPDHRTYTGSVGLDYNLRENLVLFGSYSHSRRTATSSEDEYVENTARIGITLGF